MTPTPTPMPPPLSPPPPLSLQCTVKMSMRMPGRKTLTRRHTPTQPWYERSIWPHSSVAAPPPVIDAPITSSGNSALWSGEDGLGETPGAGIP